MGANSGFSASSQTLLPSRLKRFTVTSSPRRATTIWPLRASRVVCTASRSPPAERAANIAVYMDPALPLAPGVVEAVGEGVDKLTVGQNVACLAGTAVLYGAEALKALALDLLLPLTGETRGLIDDSFLSALKQRTPLGGPVLINAGRGGLQSDDAILRALNDGRLMEASLDVFEQEPLPASSALWAHPRVFVTPHIAASSDPTALSALIARQILRHKAGESLVGVVDRSAGY